LGFQVGISDYLELQVWGLGVGGWGLGFGIWGLGFGVWGLGFGIWGLTKREMPKTLKETAVPTRL
jgi:hypothetical protein